MNDYEKLKKLLDDVRKLREEFQISAIKAGDMYEIFEEMNSDCNEEMEEIDERLEELSDEIEDGGEVTRLEKEIKELKEKRVLLEEAVDVLDQISDDFRVISAVCENINIGC